MSSERGSYRFEPERHVTELEAIIGAIESAARFEARDLETLLRRHPKDGRGFFSKSELIRGYRALRPESAGEDRFVDRVRMKPVRTLSGVAPVTVLTKPYPCPGRCIFCPSDVRMPKSYLSSEPGARRAAAHQFDPYRQTLARLRALHHTGHPVNKVELIVLGGTWSSYPEAYQVWFVLRCLEAMNSFFDVLGEQEDPFDGFEPAVDYRQLEEAVDGRAVGWTATEADGDRARVQPSRRRRAERDYNRVVRDWTAAHPRAASEAARQTASWADLEAAQRLNETSRVRLVGLSLETRPDRVDPAEALCMRRLGATKVQIGIQSMDDEVLLANGRGHDVEQTRRAVRTLRHCGFKIQAHWMPNLYRSTPAEDCRDFDRLFDDPGARPDELKIYPCSLLESAALMAHFQRGAWQPYEGAELLEVLVHCLGKTPRYCRLSRVIRDIPGTEIVTGNRTTNLRQAAETATRERGVKCRDIRAREIAHRRVAPDRLRLRRMEYEAALGTEVFLEFVAGQDLLAGFLRLRLPPRSGRALGEPPPIAEIAGAALIREVHVYGAVVGFGERGAGRSQHAGLGRRLIAEALDIAAAAGFERVAVISSVGTRAYYRRLGFSDGELYQHRPTRPGLESSPRQSPGEAPR